MFNFYSNCKSRRLIKFIFVLVAITIIVLFMAPFEFPPTASASHIPECSDSSENTTTAEEDINISESVPTLIDIPIRFEYVEYQKFYTIKDCTSFATFLSECSNTLVDAINSDLYTPSARGAMCVEDIRLTDILRRVEGELVRMASWEQEYYYAAKVWEFLLDHGYSPVIASAIIGNMAVETAGGSLELNPLIYSPSGTYYGLCQWSLKYRPEADGMTFEEQLEYLNSDMAKEFKTFGKCYKKGFTFDDFLAMEDPAEAALAFAKVYERCGTGSYEQRKHAAVKIYEYFTFNSN